MRLWVMLGMALALCTTGASADELSQCDRELRKTFEALQAYRRTHAGAYPPRLATLQYSGLLPAGGGICPNQSSEVRGGNTKHRETSSRGENEDPDWMYEYELAGSFKKYRDDWFFLPDGTPPYTRGQCKAELLRRPYSNQVPILRCSGHRESSPPTATWDAVDARRNLTAEGTIYWSGTYWAQLWVDDVPLTARDANVLFGLRGPPFHSGKPPEVSQALDLRPWVCAFGDRAWWWTYPMFDQGTNRQWAAHLGAFFDSPAGAVRYLDGTTWWIDGLVQLQGRPSGRRDRAYQEPYMVAFSSMKRGAAVSRRIAAATWLQGTVWRSNVGDIVGWLVWHYADNREERVPMVYGQTTARFWGDLSQIASEHDFPAPIWKHHESQAEVGKERWLRLYQQNWTNPHPKIVVTSLDFVSNTNSPAAPFLISVNVLP